MDITKRLQELDPTLQQHNEGHWDEPFDPNWVWFSSFNDAGVECEVGEFLYAMVRVLKPRQVLETGTHIGVGAAYIGQALKDNHKGNLTTIEFLPENFARANKRIDALELRDQVRTIFGDVAQYKPLNGDMFDLILLDTEPQTRFAEFEQFWPYLSQGGYVFIHDLHRHMQQVTNEEHGFAWPFGPVTDFMKAKIKSGQARAFHFPTPRGLTGFYKVSQIDYSWEQDQVWE